MKAQPKANWEMTRAEFERWLRRHKITGTGAVAAGANRRLARIARNLDPD